jgi:hypothetical protein
MSAWKLSHRRYLLQSVNSRRLRHTSEKYAEEVQRQVAEASAAIEEAANRQREYFAADEAAATAESNN